MQLSVIIPCYNEEERIIPTLRSVCAYLDKKYDYEIIVVDDGSEDKTRECVREFLESNPQVSVRLLKNERNRGKGFSVRRGMREGEGEYLLFSDADGSTPIEELDKLSYWLDKDYDIAIGSRGMKESQVIVYQMFYRKAMGKIFNKLVRALVLPGFADTQCGFKLFKREASRKVFSSGKVDRFCFDVEALRAAKKLGFRIKEVPVRWINSPYSHVHPVFDSIRMFIDLIKIRYQNLS